MLTLVAAALIAAQSAPTPTRVASPLRPSARDVRAFDVAGVRLGMTLEEARTALVKAGFQVRESALSEDSWEQRIRDEVERRQGARDTRPRLRHPYALQATGSRQQKVTVGIGAGPEGARVSSVEYSIPRDQIAIEDFNANVVGKYGPPHVKGGYENEMHWCTVKEQRCALSTSLRYPNLSVRSALLPPNTHQIKLRGNDRDEDARLKAAFAAEVERRAPKTRDTAF